MPNSSPVLLAEDDPNDVILLRRAFQENSALNPVHAVGNGEEAIQYLAGEEQFADRAAYPFPALFLLDLKMPVKDGLEVLRWLHQHPEIPRKLPVVVLSSSGTAQRNPDGLCHGHPGVHRQAAELCGFAGEDPDSQGVLAGLRGRRGALKR